MMQILEQTQDILTLRNRPIRNWILAAFFLPIHFSGTGFVLYVLIVPALRDGLDFQTVLILCLIVLGCIYLPLDIWIHAKVTKCSFDKKSRIATFISYGITPETTQFSFDEIVLVGVETVEGVSRGGVILRRHRPYLRLRGNRTIPLSANYIGLQPSTDIVTLIQDLLR